MIVNYAFKLNDMEKTRGLAEHIYYEETEGSQGAALAVINAQAEIDALPDPMIGLWEMEEYGYSREEMLPLTKETALELFDRDLPVYQLHEDGSETLIGERRQVTEYEGIFGIEKADWENEKSLLALHEELSEGRANKEAQLLYGDSDKYGIYQLKDIPEMRQFRYSRYHLLFSACLHPFNKSDQQPDVLIGHGVDVFDCLLLCQSGRLLLVEKFHGCHAQVFADIQEFTHGWQCSAGGDAADIAGAVAQIQAHFSFGDLFFLAETGDAVPDKLFVHF